MGKVKVSVVTETYRSVKVTKKGTYECNGNGVLDITIFARDGVENVIEPNVIADNIVVNGKNELYVFPAFIINIEVSIKDLNMADMQAILVGNIEDTGISNVKSGTNIVKSDRVINIDDRDYSELFKRTRNNFTRVYDTLFTILDVETDTYGDLILPESRFIKYIKSSLTTITKTDIKTSRITLKCVINDRHIIQKMNQNKAVLIAILDVLDDIAYCDIGSESNRFIGERITVTLYPDKAEIKILSALNYLNVEQSHSAYIYYHRSYDVTHKDVVDLIAQLDKNFFKRHSEINLYRNSTNINKLIDAYGFVSAFLMCNILTAFTMNNRQYKHLYLYNGELLMPVENDKYARSSLMRDKQVLYMPPLTTLIKLFPEVKRVIRKYGYSSCYKNGNVLYLGYDGKEEKYSKMSVDGCNMSDMVNDIFKAIAEEE